MLEVLKYRLECAFTVIRESDNVFVCKGVSQYVNGVEMISEYLWASALDSYDIVMIDNDTVKVIVKGVHK